MANTCNPSNSGGRDQEDHASKPTWGQNSRDPSQRRAGGGAQGAGPELKPQYRGWGGGRRRKRRTGAVAQAGECLPSKCKALSSNSVTPKKKKRINRRKKKMVKVS
jgi:hypothetical protein